MHFILHVVLIAQIFVHQCQSEWVKISQTSDANRNTSKVGFKSESKAADLTAPSPVWIEYQKERFSGSNISNKLIVSGESHLKTSAEIIVPAKRNNMDPTRHKVVRTKTKLSLDDSSASEDSQRSTIDERLDDTLQNVKPARSPADVKFPSFAGFVKFLASLQRNLLTKTSFGIMGKIKALKKIRDQLMLSIEDRFSVMFPKSRQKRGITDEASFQFPSETALMSISFLTFSVFLIKLVLQVIHILKSKHYTYTGMAMNSMNAKSRMNARKFGESHEDLETLRKVSAALKVNPFNAK